MKHLIIYHNYIPKVGGIETAIYNLAKVLRDTYKVTICFQSAEANQSLIKYSEVADIKRLTDPFERIECDVCLIASNHVKPKQIVAKRYLQWIHSDYRKYNLNLVEQQAGVERYVDQYIAVSAHAGKVAKDLFKINPVVIQNVLDPEFKLPEHENILHLVTNSRISPEKGFKRMVTLAEGFKEAGIRFEWLVFGDNTHRPQEMKQTIESFRHIPEVIFAGYKEDIRGGLAQADYLVQLSDFEGCPYSVLEALSVGVPCILTKFDSAGELVQDGVNGYLVPLNMKGIDYKRIANHIPKDFTFSQDGLKEKWMEIIG